MIASHFYFTCGKAETKDVKWLVQGHRECKWQNPEQKLKSASNISVINWNNSV